MAAAEPAPIVTLITDFGLSDPYVAQMKGVLLRTNPILTIVDITHDVQPLCVRQAAFITQCSWPFYPANAIHVAVVDPGVGTERRAIALETPRGCFVGPDNGVLSSALPDEARPPAKGLERLPTGCRAISITNRHYILDPVSATFHGRDVFAPVAAHLSRGVPLEELGEPIDAIMMLAPLRALRQADGSLCGEVLHIDRFGNVITDVLASDVPQGSFVVTIAGRSARGPVRTYRDASGLAAIFGSGGYVEIALPNGSAAAELDVALGASALLQGAG